MPILAFNNMKTPAEMPCHITDGPQFEDEPEYVDEHDSTSQWEPCDNNRQLELEISNGS
jgi:hypothetical protein